MKCAVGRNFNKCLEPWYINEFAFVFFVLPTVPMCSVPRVHFFTLFDIEIQVQGYYVELVSNVGHQRQCSVTSARNERSQAVCVLGLPDFVEAKHSHIYHLWLFHGELLIFNYSKKGYYTPIDYPFIFHTRKKEIWFDSEEWKFY